MNIKHILFLLAALFVVGCDHGAAISDTDADITPDGMVVDVDSGVDAGVDSDVPDSGSDALVDSGVDSDVPDSGVDANVVVTVCGNGVLEAGEGCDDGNLVTEVCGYDSPCTVCNGSCQSVAGVVPTCGDGNVDPVEDCDTGLSNAAMSGCETDCSSTRWICGDNQTVAHIIFIGTASEVAATPTPCNVVPGSVELFDGDPVALNAISGVNFPYAWAPYAPNVHLSFFDNPNIFRTAIVSDGSLNGSIASKASACYHIGVTLPHVQCAYLAP